MEPVATLTVKITPDLSDLDDFEEKTTLRFEEMGRRLGDAFASSLLEGFTNALTPASPLHD